MPGATVAREIAEWVDSLSFSDIPGSVVEEVKKRFVDTMAVAVGAVGEEPVRIAYSLAGWSSGSRLSALLWGTSLRSSADMAVFANGCAARYFDFNDTYLSKEALHPSDTIPAVMAAAEIAGVDGRRLIEGIVAAYEVAARLADSYSVRSRGWDHTVYIGIASAAAAAKILGLDARGIEQAINIEVTTGLALRQTRAGELSMWKGCAAAHAARNGLFSALLAWQGMTGPSPVFEGKFGFFKVALCGDEFKLAPLGEGGLKVMETSIKYWPVEYHSMSAVEAALKIREKLGPINPDDVESIEVSTFTVSYKIIVEDPEKWDPKTRETADHSLPYIVAAALLDGNVWLDTFKPERYLARDVRKLMGKMKITVDPRYDEIYPTGIANKIKVKLKNGTVVEEESIYPPGHFKNPLDRKGVESKYHRLLESLVPAKRRTTFLEHAWQLESLRRPFEIIRELSLEG